MIIPKEQRLMKDILHSENGTEQPQEPYTTGKGKVQSKYTLSDKLWKYLQDYAAKHKAQGNGFGYGLVDGESTSRTLSARYYKDGSEILISRGKKGNPRRLTPRECARLMGYEDTYKIPVSDTQAYKQFGNSVVVPVIKAVAEVMKPHIEDLIKREQEGNENVDIGSVASA
jgi:DNA (cytosine-5)-methyltransferase 1